MKLIFPFQNEAIASPRTSRKLVAKPEVMPNPDSGAANTHNAEGVESSMQSTIGNAQQLEFPLNEK